VSFIIELFVVLQAKVIIYPTKRNTIRKEIKKIDLFDYF
jgi:hypothetical protein